MKTLFTIITTLSFIFCPVRGELNLEDFNKLSESNKLVIAQQVQQLKDAQKLNNAKDIERWVDIGTKIGMGLAGAAKELGVAANDFAKTPVGIITVLIILWHFIGSMIYHLLGGILIWIVGFCSLRWFLSKSLTVTKTGDKEKGTLREVFQGLDDDQQFGYTAVMIGILAAGTIAIFTYR